MLLERRFCGCCIVVLITLQSATLSFGYNSCDLDNLWDRGTIRICGIQFTQAIGYCRSGFGNMNPEEIISEICEGLVDCVEKKLKKHGRCYNYDEKQLPLLINSTFELVVDYSLKYIVQEEPEQRRWTYLKERPPTVAFTPSKVQSEKERNALAVCHTGWIECKVPPTPTTTTTEKTVDHGHLYTANDDNDRYRKGIILPSSSGRFGGYDNPDIGSRAVQGRGSKKNSRATPTRLPSFPFRTMATARGAADSSANVATNVQRLTLTLLLLSVIIIPAALL